jgi:hypothetical protein
MESIELLFKQYKNLFGVTQNDLVTAKQNLKRPHQETSVKKERSKADLHYNPKGSITEQIKLPKEQRSLGSYKKRKTTKT